MTDSKRWLLPEGIDELLPEQALRLESLRRDLLDLYQVWGYELVVLPFIEYLESLLTGAGHDLDLQTFKLTDQLTGRTLGVRADMTPQAARVDAHRLAREHPVRLCYLGTVLRTRPEGFSGSRSPMQVGVELFGDAGVDSEIEVLSLLLETLACAGVEQPHVDLGHVGIYRVLAREAGLTPEQEMDLFDALQRKACAEISDLLVGVSAPAAARLAALVELNGGEEVLTEARERLAGAPAEVSAALDRLQALADGVRRHHPALSLYFDLAELRGYCYHTGVVFAAFAPGFGQELARGGRYDAVGEVFGRARPAVGFSGDVKTLLNLGGYAGYPRGGAVYAPPSTDPELAREVAEQRADGVVVIRGLPGQSVSAEELHCARQWVRRDEGWCLEQVEHP